MAKKKTKKKGKVLPKAVKAWKNGESARAAAIRFIGLLRTEGGPRRGEWMTNGELREAADFIEFLIFPLRKGAR